MASENTVKRKICLIGDGGVGKTSLIKRFVLDQFDDTYMRETCEKGRYTRIGLYFCLFRRNGSF